MIESFIATHRDGALRDGAATTDETSSFWAFLTVDEVTESIAAGAIGLWAVGATEQHGPHLVTGFDHLTAGMIVERTAARLGRRAVVLPALPFGCSDYWLELGGTLSLTQGTMRGLLLDVCRSAAQAGLRDLLIVNGHSGNFGAGVGALAELGASDVRVEFVSYWDLVEHEKLQEIQPVEHGFGHAGEMETSVGLRLGSLVRDGQIPPPVGPLDPGAPGGSEVVFHRAPRPEADSRRGVIGEAAAGSAAVGEAVLEMAVAGLVAHCETVLDRALARDAEARG